MTTTICRSMLEFARVGLKSLTNCASSYRILPVPTFTGDYRHFTGDCWKMNAYAGECRWLLKRIALRDLIFARIEITDESGIFFWTPDDRGRLPLVHMREKSTVNLPIHFLHTERTFCLLHQHSEFPCLWVVLDVCLYANITTNATSEECTSIQTRRVCHA